jgi:hypothetical protein
MNYVFDTTAGKRYRFPTHLNDLVIDRAEACASSEEKNCLPRNPH